jgi:hypothetical protein
VNNYEMALNTQVAKLYDKIIHAHARQQKKAM